MGKGIPQAIQSHAELQQQQLLANMCLEGILPNLC